MKNKRKIFKYVLRSFFGFVISVFLTFFICIKTYYFFYDTYFTFRHPRINSIITTFLIVKNKFFGDSLYYIFAVLTFILIYYLITYKKYKNILLLLNNVDEMASGNLDKRIEVNSKGDIGEVASNINNIVEQLKEITLEEKKAQQTKTDLITNVSHDLRTPLTSIIGYLNLIEEGKYKDEVELIYYTNIAYEKSLNLNVLINDLFELTKMQNKTISFNKVDINLIELISQIVSQFEIQFREINMECRVDFNIDKIMINADPIKLVRAFENLITNAMRYGKEGYYIDIKVSEEDNMSIVQVINYGESIPVVDLPHIFDRFYRVEKSRNTYGGGSGLGLAITKNIIETHDGSISASSDNNQTLFEVKIPCDE
ncbi:MAG: HAMP domain-containing sensor histidine kinase [Terrisporobacter sp.]|uniref:sensor histidine kinase n=1 Tax=Terrisporobacter sp. TaxID=1965305 RepID=UPI002FC6D053